MLKVSQYGPVVRTTKQIKGLLFLPKRTILRPFSGCRRIAVVDSRSLISNAVMFKT